MTKDELRSMINEAVAAQLDVVNEVKMDEVALAEAELDMALMNEAACFAFLESYSMIAESVMNEGYNHDTYIDPTDTSVAARAVNQYVDDRQAAKDANNLLDQIKAQDSRIRMSFISDLEKGRVSKEDAKRDIKIKEEAAAKVAKELNKANRKAKFKAVGDKIVAVYTGKEGKGKQIAAIAATATAVAGSIAAAAIRNIKKKAKAEEEKKNK